MNPAFFCALILYRLLGLILAPIIPFYLSKRVAKGKEDPARRQERYGYASLERPKGPLIWLHGASVGEAVSVLPIIESLCTQGFEVLMTTGTVTSASIMAKRLPAKARHQYLPLDRSPFVKRFLEHWKPDLALLIESEVWPELITQTYRRNIPMALLNGRMSAKSFRRWKQMGVITQPLLQSFSLCLAQSPQDAEHFKQLGLANVAETGNLKFAAPPLPVDAQDLAHMQAIVKERPLWLAASTHPGEEDLIAQAHLRTKQILAEDSIGGEQNTSSIAVLTIIVPRHPERGPDIQALLQSHGHQVALRSQQETPGEECDFYIADTIGEMGLWYRLARIVYMGGSLVPHGGQNPLEPARLKAALLSGPHMFNFAAIEALMQTRQACHIVETPERLGEEVAELLLDPAKQQQAAQAAFDIAQSQQESLTHTLEALSAFLAPLKEKHDAPRV